MLTKFIAILTLMASSLFTSYLYFTKGWGMQIHSWLWFIVFGYVLPAFIAPVFVKVQGELVAVFKGAAR